MSRHYKDRLLHEVGCSRWRGVDYMMKYGYETNIGKSVDCRVSACQT